MPVEAAVVSLEEASTIVDVTLQEGVRHGYAPLTAVVLDTGGHLVAAKRSDHSSIMRVELAFAKAWGVLAMGWSGREIVQRAHKLPQFFATLGMIAGGRMVPVAGGVPIRDGAGRLVGAVGVSGDASDNDEACAVTGIEAAGLVAWLDPLTG
ncbi:MAG: GlcG/HbpS family heme-binding protein [Acidimicrobiales bacterium]